VIESRDTADIPNVENLSWFPEHSINTEGQLNEGEGTDADLSFDLLPSEPRYRSDSSPSETINDMSSAAVKEAKRIAVDGVQRAMNRRSNREQRGQLV
jgi:hypothetical protein